MEKDEVKEFLELKNQIERKRDELQKYRVLKEEKMKVLTSLYQKYSVSSVEELKEYFQKKIKELEDKMVEMRLYINSVESVIERFQGV